MKRTYLAAGGLAIAATLALTACGGDTGGGGEDPAPADGPITLTMSGWSVIPIAAIFMLGQRYFVEGIAISGLKG